MSIKKTHIALIFLIIILSFLYLPITSATINKIYPEEYEQPILSALSGYPELNDTSINFKEKSLTTSINIKPSITFLTRKTFPLKMASRPSAGFIFKDKENREYNILIDKSLYNLKANSSEEDYTKMVTGLFAHELAHVLDYQSMSKLQIIGFGIKYKYSEKFRSRTEKRIDESTIVHGYGEEIYLFAKDASNNSLDSDAYREHRKRIYYSPEEILNLTQNN